MKQILINWLNMVAQVFMKSDEGLFWKSKIYRADGFHYKMTQDF